MNRHGPSDERPSGLSWGVWIHRYFEPKDWVAQLEKVPEDLRATAEQYLRGIAERMRTLKKLKQEGNDR